MDYERIELALVERVHNAYKDFVANNPAPIRPPGKRSHSHHLALQEYNARIAEFKGRPNEMLYKVRAHRVWLADRAIVLREKADHFGRLVALKAAIARGARVLAFDVERAGATGAFPHGQLREIGYTVYQSGKMESFNLRANGARRPRWIGFSYGETERLDESVILERVIEEMEKAEFYVGHSLNIDIQYLTAITANKLPRRPVYDTYNLSFLIDEVNRSSLSNVANYFGIDTPQPHCGGNDARYNMELVLAMVVSLAPDA